MKSLATSAALHTALLTVMLVSFGSPRPLDLTQGEALPVSVVPIEEYSQAVLGDADAEMTDTPAPTPTEAPERTPMPAENVGNNEVDLESPPQPVAAPRETVQAATADAPPPPAPPEPAEETPPPPAEEPEPAPQPEAPAEAAPEPEPAPVEEAAVEPAPPQPPQNVPLPQVRPQPPRPPEPPRQQPTRTAEAQPQQRETANDTREKEFDADEVAALLNRQESAGGGARRSQQQASLGGTHTTGARLSQSEYDALRGQVSRCWSPPSGVSDAGSLRVSLRLQLDQSGQLIGLPEIIDGGSGSTAQRVAAEAAVRAVRRCAPYALPAEKYETWKDVVFNFDPSQMF